MTASVDMVNSPPHYTRGPKIITTCPNCEHKFSFVLECIQVIRWIRDFRLATAIKYLWRVGFGGKFDDTEDVAKSIWYCQDYVDNSLEDQ